MLRRFCFWLMVGLLALPVSAQSTTDDCRAGGYMPTRLIGSIYARVTPSVSNNVHENYSLSSPVIATISSGEVVAVGGTPVCAEGYVWYQIMYRTPTSAADFPFGYAAEGDPSTGTYFLEPVPQSIVPPGGTLPIQRDNVYRLKQVADVGTNNGSVPVFWSTDSTRLSTGILTYNLTDGSSAVYHNPAGKLLYPTDVSIADDNNSLLMAGSLTDGYTSAQPGGIQVWKSADPIFPTTEQVLLDNYNTYSAATNIRIARVALGRTDGKISIFDNAVGGWITDLGGLSLLGMLRFSRAGNILVAAGGDGMGGGDTNVYVWETGSWSNLMIIPGTVAPNIVAVSDDGQLVARPDRNPRDPSISQAYVTDVPFNHIATTYMLEPDYTITGLAISPDKSLLAIAAQYIDNTAGRTGVVFVDIATGRDVGWLLMPIGTNIGSVSFSPDGRILSVVHSDPLFWPPQHLTLWVVG